MSTENNNIPEQPADEVKKSVEKDIGDPTRFLDELIEDVKVTQETEASEQPIPTNQDNPEKSIKGVTRTNYKQNVEVRFDVTTPGANLHREEGITTTAAGTDEIKNRLDSVTAPEVGKNKNAAEWAATVSNGFNSNSFDGAGLRILAKEGSFFTQSIPYANIELRPGNNSAVAERGEIVTGAKALSALQRHVGLGGNFTVPLWHSGFWVTLKPVMEEVWLELHRQIQTAKSELGRDTYGLMLNASNGVTNEIIMRYALLSIIRNSSKEVDDILKIISVHDINTLMWGYMSVMYPNGFNHKVACLADPTECTHIVEDILNVRRLLFVNKNALSDKQLSHMTSTAHGSMSAESIQKYRAEMATHEERVITLCEGTDEELKMTLRVPSAYEYFDSTNRWINSIGTKVIQSLGADSSNQERNVVIMQHAAASVMRKYTHFVKSIDFGGIINDQETIEEALTSLSTSIQLRNDFEKKINQYIEDTCISIVGVPDFKCPSCGKYQITDEGQPPLQRSVVPLDITATFFMILVQRVQSVLAQES